MHKLPTITTKIVDKFPFISTSKTIHFESKFTEDVSNLNHDQQQFAEGTQKIRLKLLYNYIHT